MLKWRRSGRTQLIFFTEILPVLVAKKTWSEVLKNRRVFFYIDNEAAKAALIRGFSPLLDASDMLFDFRAGCAAAMLALVLSGTFKKQLRRCSHLIRKHAKEWHTHSQEVSRLCVSHKNLLHRDAPCPYCGKVVYGVERHAIQCPVLFQVCLLHLMRVSTSAESATWQDLRQLDKPACIEHLQEEALTFFTRFAQPLNRFCLLCAQEGQEECIVDMQHLKRHFRDAHFIQKDSLASICDLHFASIVMQRPCNFCSQQYQKSPQLHKSKCVPLVQILALTYGQYGRPGISRGAGGGSVGACQPIVHTQSEFTGGEQFQQAPQGGDAPQVPASGQRQGRQGQRSRQKKAGTLSGRRPSLGGTPLFLGVPAAQDPGPSTRALPTPVGGGQGVRPLFQHKRHEHSGHLRLNPTRWSYTMWDQDKQQSLPTEAPALTNQEIVAALKILKAAALTDGVIHKFSPLHRLSDNPQSKVVVFQLVLTTRPTAEKVHAEMSKLTNLAVTSLVGLRIRPERLQISPLARQLIPPEPETPAPRPRPDRNPGF